ncbi:DUF6883 domain-containing protein [Gloeocapsopsis dulcis]|uniref:DUF6883 domain-containing protein n=1 Tax=Gloeocapsopsis dulcis AAB1 = 1H9 TaxID=1433147 RepID=A0A6N8G5Z6_9CHRO|nr:DUF6883 domain-containing protein [Gloeocapsopsis dulcis]MUL39357.1 hypothetical protein [Gloeocapsopsis dulcis AAB1 = 1H9]WNN89685.1 hypothetical protein P0S91_00880 [Gloeocapsopsis dulcis]
MKLPNGAKAQLGDKPERYCLNMEHPKGKDKAIMFGDRLGITLFSRVILANALLESAIASESCFSLDFIEFNQAFHHSCG